MKAADMNFGAIIIGDEILSGKRQDKHFAKIAEMLGARGLRLSWVEYLGDDRTRLTETFRRTLASGDVVFSCGGIGNTPDDHTRQAVAAALGVGLELSPEGVAEAKVRFGDDMTPERLQLVTFPAGTQIVPNPFNRIPGFMVPGRHHYFVPGFPQMAWPMMDWVLATRYPDLVREPPIERAIAVYDAGESQLLPLMDAIVARFPRVRLFSLPAFLPDGGRRIELGVRVASADVDVAFEPLRDGIEKSGFRHEPIPDRR